MCFCFSVNYIFLSFSEFLIAVFVFFNIDFSFRKRKVKNEVEITNKDFKFCYIGTLLQVLKRLKKKFWNVKEVLCCLIGVGLTSSGVIENNWKTMDKEKTNGTQSKNKPRRLRIKRSSTKENNRTSQTQEANSPPPFQSKLQSLFAQIEKEFQKLHDQNQECKFLFFICSFFCSFFPSPC